MFNWFRKKEAPAQPSAPQRREGFFSTDEFFERGSVIDPQRILAKSFQRGPADMSATGAGGKTIAMDEAYPGLRAGRVAAANNDAVNWTQLNWYAGQGFIGYQLAAMIAQHWLVDKACTMPARDAVRNGWEITVNDGTEVKPEILEEMSKIDKRMRIKSQCVEFVRFGRIFGIRIALPEIESSDPYFYEKPFNIDGVKPGSYRGITQVDPYWITPMLDADAASNPASMHFYEPTWWLINGRRIHRTHLIINRNGDEVADILKPSYFYGGIPVPQKIMERVYAAERTANEAPMLAMTKRTIVMNMDITQAVSQPDAFTRKMQTWTEYMNNFGVKVVGEGEQINQYDTSLTDLDAVIMTQYQLVSAGSEVPATKLLGTSPKGFGASGEYETESYHELLESIEEHDITPLIQRHHELVIKSIIAPQFGIKPFSTEIVWNPTDTPTAKEQAEINKLQSETDNNWVQSGALDGEDVRNRLINDPDSGYNGISPLMPADVEDPDADKGDASEGDKE